MKDIKKYQGVIPDLANDESTIWILEDPEGFEQAYEKVDGSAAGLEPHPCAAVHLFR